MGRLSESEIEAGLGSLAGWSRQGESIEGSWRFADFRSAFAFLVQVALLAERADHHPEIWNVYDRVRLSLTTHDAGGLTARDFELAGQIDALEGGRGVVIRG